MQPWDLAERLLAAADADAAWRVGADALADLGVAGAIWVDAAGQGAPRLRSTLGPAWEEGNRQALAAGRDPFPLHCLSHMAPLRTGAAYLDRYAYLPGAAKRLVREAADSTGFVAGTSIPVLAGAGGRGQGWNLMAEGGAAELDLLLRDRGTLLACAAHLIHARLTGAGGGGGDPPRSDPDACARLTPRERDCLAFVADGLRTAELAHRLEVSEATVEFHLANARRKLGARTRDHAVALAIRSGMLGS